jgi:hypothetical protein
MCAAKELQTLGIHFAPEYLEALRRTAAARPRHRRDVAKDAKAVDVEPMSNQDFAYIAGHTAAGLPFGVTWEEMEGLDRHDGPFTGHDFGKGDFEGPRPLRGR